MYFCQRKSIEFSHLVCERSRTNFELAVKVLGKNTQTAAGFSCRIVKFETEQLLTLLGVAIASSIIVGRGGGGADIHIFVFIGHKNHRFQKKLIVQNQGRQEGGG